MSHVRTQIRAKLILLIEQVEGLAGRVVPDASEIRDAEAGPWAEVALGVEGVGARMLGNRHAGKTLVRQVEVSVTLHTRGKAEAVERYEDLLAAVEAAVFRDRQLGGLLVTPLTLTAIQPFEPSTEGSMPRHSVRASWTCTYSTTESDASVVSSQ